MTLLTVPSTSESVVHAKWFHLYDIVRLSVGAILLTAAAMKGYELATGPVAEKSLLTSRWFLIVAVEFELVLGLCLIGGLWKRLIWQVTLLCITGFTCITAYKMWHSETSCGCFGRVAIKPLHTFALDIAFLAMLLMWKPRVHIMRLEWRKAAMIAVASLSIGVPVGIAMASARTSTITASGQITGNGRFVALLPEQWVGERLPLLDWIDIGNQLATQKWYVALYHHDCHDCQAQLPIYIQAAQRHLSVGDAHKFALIRVPPYGDEKEIGISSQTSLSIGHLSDQQTWFVRTPVLLEIENGIVLAVKDHIDDVKPSAISTSRPTDWLRVAEETGTETQRTSPSPPLLRHEGASLAVHQVIAGGAYIPLIRSENIYGTNVRIEDMRSSCSCTTPNVGMRSIGPGEFTDIPLVFRPNSVTSGPTSILVLASSGPLRESSIARFDSKTVAFFRVSPSSTCHIRKSNGEQSIQWRIAPVDTKWESTDWLITSSSLLGDVKFAQARSGTSIEYVITVPSLKPEVVNSLRHLEVIWTVFRHQASRQMALLGMVLINDDSTGQAASLPVAYAVVDHNKSGDGELRVSLSATGRHTPEPALSQADRFLFDPSEFMPKQSKQQGRLDAGWLHFSLATQQKGGGCEIFSIGDDIARTLVWVGPHAAEQGN